MLFGMPTNHNRVRCEGMLRRLSCSRASSTEPLKTHSKHSARRTVQLQCYQKERERKKEGEERKEEGKGGREGEGGRFCDSKNNTTCLQSRLPSILRTSHQLSLNIIDSGFKTIHIFYKHTLTYITFTHLQSHIFRTQFIHYYSPKINLLKVSASKPQK